MIKLIRTSLILLCMGISSGQISAGSIIVSPDVQLTSVDSAFLVSVFSMRVTRWQNGTPIRVFVYSDRDSEHYHFVKKHLRIFPYQLRNIWDRAVYTGTGEAPREVKDAIQMLESIRTTKGAIGYIADDEVTMEGVRVIDEY